MEKINRFYLRNPTVALYNEILLFCNGIMEFSSDFFFCGRFCCVFHVFLSKCNDKAWPKLISTIIALALKMYCTLGY